MLTVDSSDEEMYSETSSQAGGQDPTPDSAATENTGEPIFGSKPEVKALYSTSNPECDCAPRWSEHAEAAEEDRMLKKLGAAAAIIQRFKRSREGQWQTSAIEVQSPRLNRVLADVLRDYPDVVVREGEATKFAAPFKPLFHRWGRLLEWRDKEEEGGQTKVELGLLVDALKPTLEPLFSVAGDMHRTGEIDFDNMWTVFVPGELMVFRCGSVVKLFRLHDLHIVVPRREPRFWVLTLQQIEWNGRYFGVVQGKMRIVEADKPLQFDKLSVQPLATQRDEDAIRKRYLAKGNKYLELCSHKCLVKTYKGTKYVLNSELETIREKPLSGRIAIDPFAFFTCQSDIAPKQPRLNGGDSDAFFSGDKDLFEQTNELDKEEQNEESEMNKVRGLEKRLLCLVDRIKGFDLRNNEWCEFDVDDVSEPVWNDNALHQLVLSEGEKKLLVAFTQRDELDLPDFDDVILDKGKGIIILLAGPPGVGKTLTAESISERARVPLYSLRASDLGTDSDQVEATLKDALECCKLWNAVLLIDEADVFMEKRSADRLEQNELVSIFLRNLEYYQGVMFLTTNRVDAIDDAFRSRIDLILTYPNLDHAARRQIWSTFISSLPSGSCNIADIDFDELARTDMNGRDIKNVVKIARFLAASEKIPLSMEHLRTILTIKKASL
ncbi:AAA family protein [Lasiodiplodia theobromae]|uniref:AAA family protein n=1 Tax=Lasiodiplodia theobromae TaxID=45133 RepID=UPI0015C40DDE|nr:AAA family protein [Lasiodiplodia theobromae]KAF4534968.1 AAA family protein [Lasiodiplodia theobromae]